MYCNKVTHFKREGYDETAGIHWDEGEEESGRERRRVEWEGGRRGKRAAVGNT